MNTYKDFLTEYTKEFGFTDEALSEIMDCSRSSVTKWKNGTQLSIKYEFRDNLKKYMTKNNQDKWIEDFLKIESETLFKEEEQKVENIRKTNKPKDIDELKNSLSEIVSSIPEIILSGDMRQAILPEDYIQDFLVYKIIYGDMALMYYHKYEKKTLSDSKVVEEIYDKWLNNLCSYKKISEIYWINIVKKYCYGDIREGIEPDNDYKKWLITGLIEDIFNFKVNEIVAYPFELEKFVMHVLSPLHNATEKKLIGDFTYEDRYKNDDGWFIETLFLKHYGICSCKPVEINKIGHKPEFLNILSKYIDFNFEEQEEHTEITETDKFSALKNEDKTFGFLKCNIFSKINKPVNEDEKSLFFKKYYIYGSIKPEGAELLKWYYDFYNLNLNTIYKDVSNVK